jgi:PPK2 family polyphosphate:nucleotide phosphotransferase
VKHSEKEKVRERFIVKGGSDVDLSRGFKSGLDQAAITKETAKEHLDADIKRIAHYQDILYAQDNYALLIIFQAMDAAGKDSTIKHVMSGINPQGCQVFAFKAPSSEELDHDYLWRCTKALPERGRIGIFNRSYYEEVLVSRVHPEILDKQQLPPKLRGKGIWKRRFEQINNYEKHLVENGTVILKFFLNVSKKEQKKRFLARLNDPEKNWKFASSDAVDRELTDPARAGQVNLAPSVQVGEVHLRAAGAIQRFHIRRQLDQVARYKARRQATVAQQLHHQPARVTA